MFVRIMMFLFVVVPVFALAETVPHTFTAGTPAKANQVNDNFFSLDTRVSWLNMFAVGDIKITEFTSESASSFALVSCESGTSISASCSCSDDDGTRNYGVLDSCEALNFSAFSGCVPEALTYDNSLPFPRAEVTVKCLEATTIDGSEVDIPGIWSKPGHHKPVTVKADEERLEVLRKKAEDYMSRVQNQQLLD